MPREKSWSQPSEKSSGSNLSSLREALKHDDGRRTLAVYVVSLALLLGGGFYSLWRIHLLNIYLAENRRIALEYHKAAAEMHAEILKRLPAIVKQ